MSSDHNIEMSTDDTLELDAIIKEWNATSSSVVGDIKYEGGDSTSHSLSGLQTNTAIFDPQDAGTYTIPINGQELSVKVTDANALPDEWVNNFESQDGISPTDAWGSETRQRNDGTQTDTWETSSPISGKASRKIASNGGGVQYSYTRTEPITPNVISGKIKGFQRSGAGGDEYEIRIYSGSNLIIRMQMQANGSFSINDNSVSGSWSLNTVYELRAFNIDWGAEKHDWEIIDLDSETTVVSAVDEPFRDTGSSLDGYWYAQSSGSPNGSGNQEALYDDLFIDS